MLLALIFVALTPLARAETVITEKSQLNRAGMRLGVSTGSADIFDRIQMQRTFRHRRQR
jgi:hypothetical protein